MLLPINQRVIPTGSIVVSDEWCAYRGIPNFPGIFHHRIVTILCIQTLEATQILQMESYWRRAKASFKKVHGTSKAMMLLSGRVIWSECLGETSNMVYCNILKHMAVRYPCQKTSLYQHNFPGPPKSIQRNTRKCLLLSVRFILQSHMYCVPLGHSRQLVTCQPSYMDNGLNYYLLRQLLLGINQS